LGAYNVDYEAAYNARKLQNASVKEEDYACGKAFKNGSSHNTGNFPRPS
jgi:hypothetical protein